MPRRLIRVPLLVAAAALSAVAVEAAEPALPEPLVARMFAYATMFEVKGGTPDQTRLSRFRSSVALGNLLQRFSQLEIAVAYVGPSPEVHPSLLVSIAEAPAAPAGWLVERVSVEGMGNLIVSLIQEGLFQSLNGARPMPPDGPYYLLSVRSADGALGYHEALKVEPGECDDANGLPRPEIARRFLWLGHEAAGASFGELLKPLLPLRMSIRTDRNEYRPGDSVSISGELLNAGRTRISALGPAVDPRVHDCRITDSGGRIVPRDRDFKGQRLAAAPSDFFVLGPGESRTFRIDATHGLLQPLAAGAYRIGCTYTGGDRAYDPVTRTSRRVRYPWRWSTRSNDVTITVVESDAAGRIGSPSPTR